MKILPHILEKIQTQILSEVCAKRTPMFELGIMAFSLQRFQSINSNARRSRKNAVAAERQVYRLLDVGMRRVFARLVVKLFAITNESVIAVDFSVFHPFAVLCFALQTRDGRAIPVWVDVLRYPITSPTSQNLFILNALSEFLEVVGCRPTIVCDRGFIGRHLVHGFLELGVRFCVRLKSGMHWKVDGRRRQFKKQWPLDEQGVIYDKHLRVVRSSKTMQHQSGAKEPWYILTNDLSTDKDTILQWYYHRFEIEETFRDLKHIFSSKAGRISKPQTLCTILWFQSLGIWLCWKAKQLIPRRKHPKKRCSWTLRIFDALQAEVRSLAFCFYPNRKEATVT
jgi:hypothetical protein